MSETADVVVIGGGCNGASIAFHLAERGVRRVVLLEKGALASGPTGRSTAIVRQHYSNEVTARMALESLRVFQQWGERIGGTCGFVRTGFLVGVREGERAALEGNVALQRGVGIDVRIVAGDELRRLEPELFTEDLVSAAYEPEAGYCDPVSTTTSLAEGARARGARIVQGREVTGIRVEGGRVAGVDTTAGPVAAASVVVAAGPWAQRLAARVGVELPIEPSRHPVCAFRRPPDFARAPMIYADFVHQFYTRPETGDLSLVGSIDPADAGNLADPDRYNEGVDLETITEFGGRASRRYPALERGFSRGGWAGIYDVTPDWHPVLDAIEEVPGLFVAAGFSGHGFKLCPAVGAMMAGLVTTGRRDERLELFRADRFRTGRLIRGKYEYSIIG
ncbi:MAG: FAD-binding oxidoreductase [Candidatus Rokubacteria bacterium]|nr:FAD-binding oxidoreductase [Candidatus Rokubacteria bacterium]